MPAPSRDRLPRPVDISTLFSGAARRVNLIVDEPGLRWAGLSGTNARNVSGTRSDRGGGLAGRRVRVGGTAARGRARGGVLPSSYARTPLRDITSIVRAVERRRAELHNDQAAEASQEEINAPLPSNTQLEQDIGASTPIPTVAVKPQLCLSPATQLRKFIAGLSNEQEADSSFLTPQKKLLNSIEKVREVWLQEQQKLERTPAAKKAEREKKVRTLMSMR